MRAQPLLLLTVCLTGILGVLYEIHPRLLTPASLAWLSRRQALARSIPDLARDVGHRNAEVAAAARRELLEEIAATRLKPTPQAAQELIELADELAEQCAIWHENTGAENAVLARRILAAAGNHFPAVTRDALVARCEVMLRATHARSIASAEVAAQDAAETAGFAPLSTITSQHPLAAAGFNAPLAQFPGGGLVVERAGPVLAPPVDVHSTISPLAEESLAKMESIHEPTVVDNSMSISEIDSEDREGAPLPLTAPSEQFRKLPRSERDFAVRKRQPISAAAAVVAVQNASQGSARPTSPVIQMAQRLHSPVDATRLAARTELRAIGYSEVHLDLLHSATDADAAKRAAAARALPVMRGMNARPWLVWLSYDDTEEVRHAALSVLSTSYDAELVDRMREAVNTDPAPRVRRLAEKYLTTLARR